MRKMFVEGSLAKAKEDCPWASVYIHVTHGYMCFESLDEALVWKEQK